MRLTRLFPLFVLILLIALPAGIQAQSQLVEVEHFSWSGVWFIPGINGGEGEEVYLEQEYWIYAHEVETPSGHYKQLGYLVDQETWVGQESGHTWTVNMENAPIVRHWYKDGSFMVNEAIHFVAENQDTGERILFLQRWHRARDAEGNWSKNTNMDIIGWHYLPPK